MPYQEEALANTKSVMVAQGAGRPMILQNKVKIHEVLGFKKRQYDDLPPNTYNSTATNGVADVLWIVNWHLLSAAGSNTGLIFVECDLECDIELSVPYAQIQ